jgi:hypothetical protein
VTVCYQYRMLWRRIFALSLALIALAAPASSFAQNAGQDQYQDPLAGGNGSSTGGGSTGGGSTGGGSTGSGTTSGGSTGGGTTSTPSTSPTSTPSTGAAASGTTADPATGAQAPGELPRTGFDVILTFELGVAMLLLGLVSHRLLVLRDRRHH